MPEARSLICKGCWQNLHMPVALRGVLSVPYRVVGLRPSRMNPNTCTFCELMFSKVMRKTKITIDATILFADLRGYTSLSQSLSVEAMGQLLDIFYDECADAIWRHDGLLNKTIGDAVMAVFNFPIKQEDHARQALLAAREIQAQFADRQKEIAGLIGTADGGAGIGIGIDSGPLSFGEFGRSHRDLTAIGTVLNTASRAQSAAMVHQRAPAELSDSTAAEYRLKGFDQPIELYTA